MIRSTVFNLPAMQAFVLGTQTAYARGDVALEKSADGRRTLTVTDDVYALTDEFDDGNPFCGISRLLQKSVNRVVWNGYYHGWLTQDTKDDGHAVADIFDFLRLALRQPAKNTVLRGAPSFQNDAFEYTNTLEFGAFDCFYGHETIHDMRGTLLYFGRYGGGLVGLTKDRGEA